MRREGASREATELDRALTREQVGTALFGPQFGSVRLGRFVLLGRIGNGSMGVVYEARDTESGALVAIKALPRLDGRAVARFKREFRSLSDVVHPNLVSFYELFSESGQWFFSMELVTGVPFVHFVRPEAELDEARLRSALAQLAAAVVAIHAAGKLHCDIKPSNVLVTSEGRVVVLDFGLASEIHSDGAAESIGTGIIGTPAYAAPEQAGEGRLSRASDWYSVGVMLFEALTGKLPFAGAPLDIVNEKRMRDAPDPAVLASASSADLCVLCRGLLARDAAARPAGDELLALAPNRAAPPLAIAAPAASSVFVGRERELGELERALLESQKGRAISIMVGGPSGIGKSALLSSFAERLGDRALLLRGRCHEHEAVPYKVFDAVVDAIARHLRAQPESLVQQLIPRHVDALRLLFPVLGRIGVIARIERPTKTEDARTQRNHAFAALRELLLRLTDHVPLVLMVDDLQWGDADSARMLAHVLGPPDPPPLLFVGAYRSEEEHRSEFLQHAFDPTAEAMTLKPERLALGPLEQDVASELATRLLGNTRHAAAIAAEARGVPFFITELAQHASRRGEAQAEPAATSLEALILERLAQLPEAAQALVRVFAIAAGPIELALAAEAAGVASDPVYVGALRAARFVRTRGNGPLDTGEPYHDRVRETVAASLTPEQTQAIHAAIAHAMERRGMRDAERLLLHCERAGQRERAAAYALAAARSTAAQLAFNRAAELFQKAIALLPEGVRADPELYSALGAALANAGRGAQAAAAYLQAARHLPELEARALKRMATRQLLRSGRINEALGLARTLFDDVGLSFPGSTLHTLALYAGNRTLLRASGLRYEHGDGTPPDAVTSERLATLDATFREMSIVDPMRGATLQAQFLRYARKARDARGVMDGLAWEAWNAATMHSGPRHALRVLAETDRLATAIGTPYALATAKSTRAGCLLFMGHVGEVVTPALEAERIFKEECPGTYWEQSLVATYRYGGIEHRGDFRELQREVPQRIRDSLERSDYFGAAFFTLYSTYVSLMLDRLDDAWELLQSERQRLGLPYSTFHVFVAIRTIHAWLYARDGTAALRFIEAETPRFNRSVCARARFYASTMRYLDGRCCLAAAQREPRKRQELLERAERDGHFLLRAGQPMALGLGHLLLAEAALRRGQRERALELARFCAEHTDQHQAPLFALYARHAVGSLLGGEHGRALRENADEELRNFGISDPARWTAVWIDVEDA